MMAIFNDQKSRPILFANTFVLAANLLAYSKINLSNFGAFKLILYNIGIMAALTLFRKNKFHEDFDPTKITFLIMNFGIILLQYLFFIKVSTSNYPNGGAIGIMIYFYARFLYINIVPKNRR